MTKEFDFLAEARIIEWCRQAIAESVRILTEERGEVRTRPGRAAWTLIVDPVDGSENFARGNECSSVSLAALPGDRVPHPDAVSHALVGRVFGGTILEAIKGSGAWRNGVPARPAPCGSARRGPVRGADLVLAPGECRHPGAPRRRMRHGRNCRLL